MQILVDVLYQVEEVPKLPRGIFLIKNVFCFLSNVFPTSVNIDVIIQVFRVKLVDVTDYVN